MTTENKMLFCPQCGGETDQLHEGYCYVCFTYNQEALDFHNAQYDKWCKMTQYQRDMEIRDAMKRGAQR